jgi:hypothetical protein
MECGAVCNASSPTFNKKKKRRKNMKTKVKREPYLTATPILYAEKKEFEKALKKTLEEHKEALKRLADK